MPSPSSGRRRPRRGGQGVNGNMKSLFPMKPSPETQDIARPQRFFEDRFGMTSSLLERLLGSALVGRVEDADLYLEYRGDEERLLAEGAVKKAPRHVSQGAGVRAQSGERTGYAHTDDVTLGSLEEAARQARAIAERAASDAVVAVKPDRRPHDLYSLAVPPVAAA